MPKVSVVIPSYNHAPFIVQAVESVLRQSLRDLELIVVDDGSQDDTCERLARIDDPRLVVVQQENRGAHAAINRGLHMAQAPYLSILNSDDVYHPGRLDRLVAILEQDRAIGLVASHIEVIDRSGRAMGIKHGYQDLHPWVLERPELSFRAGDDLRAALLTENYLATTSNYLFRRSDFEQVGDFRALRYVHDWDFALRLAHTSRLHLVPEPLLQYRIHDTNTIRENTAAMVFEICWLLAVHLPRHIADAEWYGARPSAERVEQLLHSQYVFGCERVLATLLLHDLHRRPDRALALLEADNAERKKYLDYVETVLTGNPSPTPDLRIGALLRDFVQGRLQRSGFFSPARFRRSS